MQTNTLFEGFYTDKNFTKTSNEFLEMLIAGKITYLESRIMALFFRNTAGWQNIEKALILSNADLMDMLQYKRKNSIIEALDNLVKKLGLLEAKSVNELSAKARANIEQHIGKALHPKQKIYRLKLRDRKKRAWTIAHLLNRKQPVKKPTFTVSGDFEIANRTIGTVKGKYKGIIAISNSNNNVTDKSAENKDSNNNVTNESNNNVTDESNNNVTNSEPGAVERVAIEEPLKKGLKKSLKKVLEEEDKSISSKLVNDLVSNGHNKNDAQVLEDKLIELNVVNYSIEDVEKAIKKANKIKYVDYPYSYAATIVKTIVNTRNYKQAKAPMNNPEKPNNSHGRKMKMKKEIVPEWFYKRNEPKVEPELCQEKQAELAKRRAAVLQALGQYDEPINTAI